MNPGSIQHTVSEYVREHPNATADDVARGVGLARQAVSNSLRDLFRKRIMTRRCNDDRQLEYSLIEEHDRITNDTQVSYYPDIGRPTCYLGVVDGRPWQLGGTWVANLNMGPEYSAAFGGRTRVNGARVDALRRVPGLRRTHHLFGRSEEWIQAKAKQAIQFREGMPDEVSTAQIPAVMLAALVYFIESLENNDKIRGCWAGRAQSAEARVAELEEVYSAAARYLIETGPCDDTDNDDEVHDKGDCTYCDLDRIASAVRREAHETPNR